MGCARDCPLSHFENVVATRDSTTGSVQYSFILA
jgi:hypothetical protein